RSNEPIDIVSSRDHGAAGPAPRAWRRGPPPASPTAPGAINSPRSPGQRRATLSAVTSPANWHSGTVSTPTGSNRHRFCLLSGRQDDAGHYRRVIVLTAWAVRVKPDLSTLVVDLGLTRLPNLVSIEPSGSSSHGSRCRSSSRAGRMRPQPSQG